MNSISYDLLWILRTHEFHTFQKYLNWLRTHSVRMINSQFETLKIFNYKSIHFSLCSVRHCLRRFGQENEDLNCLIKLNLSEQLWAYKNIKHTGYHRGNAFLATKFKFSKSERIFTDTIPFDLFSLHIVLWYELHMCRTSSHIRFVTDK